MDDDPNLRQAAAVASDRSREQLDRLASIDELAKSGDRRAAAVLIQIGERADDEREVLEAAGRGLAILLEGGAPVSEWDIRNLTRTAGEAFFALRQPE